MIRKTGILIKTERKIVVRGLKDEEKIVCEQCAELMRRAQSAADLSGVSSRFVFRLIEAERLHFVETGANEIDACPESVRQAVEPLAAEVRSAGAGKTAAMEEPVLK